MATDLILYEGQGNDKVRLWTSLSPDARRRRAMEAAVAHDGVVLWDLLEAYLRAFGSAGGLVSPRTLTQYRTIIRRLLSDWRDVTLTKATRDDGAAWLNALTERGLKPGSISVYLAGARRFYEALRWTRATTADPFQDLRPPRDPVPKYAKNRPYRDDAVAALLAIADPYDAALILLCTDAGLRIFEAQAVRWEEIEWGTETLRVPYGKGGKPRSVAISPTLMSALSALNPMHAGAIRHAARRQRPDAEQYVFYWSDIRWSQRRLERLAAAAGVDFWGAHAFRHRTGARLWEATESLEATAQFLGHSDINVARIYAHMSDKTPRSVVKTW